MSLNGREKKSGEEKARTRGRAHSSPEFFSRRSDFSPPPVTASGSPRMRRGLLPIVTEKVTDNFMNVFNGVTSSSVFFHRCVLHYFLTIPVGCLATTEKPGLTPEMRHPVYKLASKTAMVS